MKYLRDLPACLLLGALLACSGVSAHELQPGSLDVRQLTTDRYEVIWRAPVYYGKPHPAVLELPESWATVGEPTVGMLGDSHLYRRVVEVPDGLIRGAEIRLGGLEATITDVFFRARWLDGEEASAVIRPDKPRIEIEGQRSMLQVAGDYTALGIDHILSGYDHLCFVLALLLLVSGWRRLLLTVTSFTVAHSITLGIASMGWFWLPGPPVEATIALSILFLASELLKVGRGDTSLTSQYPWLVAFAFGLLHGFGFAGALTEVGLPNDEIPLALLSFNLGVEVGQLLFIAVILLLIEASRRVRSEWPQWMQQLPAYGIGGLAAFWLLERLSGF